MPPVKIYTESPITAQKASGITPRTAGSDSKVSGGGDEALAGGLPQYTSAQATPTRTVPQSGPPPPQPGAVPRLPAATPTVPPPPRAGETYSNNNPPEPTAAPQMPYPPQMLIPAPTTPYSQRGTMAATSPPTGSQPSQILGQSGASPSPYAHPPGYQQNPAGVSGLDSYHGGVQAGSASFGQRDQNDQGQDDEGVLNSALKWAQAAGSKLAAAENDIWEQINKGK